MKKTELMQMDHWKLIPSIEQGDFRSYEALVTAGIIPDGFVPLGYNASLTYTRLEMFIVYQRFVSSSKGVATVQAKLRHCAQPWDMGGCFLAPMDVTNDEDNYSL